MEAINKCRDNQCHKWEWVWEEVMEVHHQWEEDMEWEVADINSAIKAEATVIANTTKEDTKVAEAAEEISAEEETNNELKLLTITVETMALPCLHNTICHLLTINCQLISWVYSRSKEERN